MVGSLPTWLVAYLPLAAYMVLRVTVVGQKSPYSVWIDRFIIGVFVVFGVAVAGFRPYEVGEDTLRYMATFERLSTWSFTEVWKEYAGRDPLFYLFSKVLVGLLGVRGTFVTYSLVFCFAIVYAAKRLATSQRTLALLLYISCFPFYSLGLNVMRSSVSMAAILVAISLVPRRKWVAVGASILLAVAFHQSALVFCAGLAAAYLLSMRMAVGVWVVSVVLAFTGYGVDTLVVLMGEQLQSILGLNSLARILKAAEYVDYRTGFRFDFFLFSVFPLLVAYGVHKTSTITSETTRFVLRLYLMLNAFFLVAVSIPYSDRIALFSWTLIPILLAMLFRETRSRSAERIAFALAVILFLCTNLLLVFQVYAS